MLIENRILDALSVFLSVPLPKNSQEFDNNSYVSKNIKYIIHIIQIL